MACGMAPTGVVARLAGAGRGCQHSVVTTAPPSSTGGESVPLGSCGPDPHQVGRLGPRGPRPADVSSPLASLQSSQLVCAAGHMSVSSQLYPEDHKTWGKIF